MSQVCMARRYTLLKMFDYIFEMGLWSALLPMVSAALFWRGLASQNVSPAALIFDLRRIRIALERILDGKTSIGEVALDFLPAE